MTAPEEDNYESLPTTSSVSTHMIAGAAAGVMEHTIMYPIDSVKTRMQSLLPHPKAHYRNITDALIRISGQEGLKSTVRGIRAVVYGAAPAHAMYFACYEKCKKTLSTKGHSNHLVHGFSGCMATILHDAVMNPADVVKQRMQMYNSPYRSCMHCIRTVYKQEGFRAFYRSYTTQLGINIPFQSLHFMTYEFCQDKLNPNRTYDPKSHVLSGGIAGGLAAAATTPLDVCKTLLNTQDTRTVKREGSINGIRQAIQTIWKYHGVRGFFKGVSARVLYVMPGTAISWSVYEFFKFVMTHGKGPASCDAYSKPPAVHVVRASNDECEYRE